MFTRCHHMGLSSRLGLAITTELYARKDITEETDLISEYFEATLKPTTGDDCPICMNVDEDMVKPVCGHSFCRKCICDWCMIGKPTCPMCRNKIYSNVIE